MLVAKKENEAEEANESEEPTSMRPARSPDIGRELDAALDAIDFKDEEMDGALAQFDRKVEDQLQEFQDKFRDYIRQCG
jgi:hypothetical protein